MNIESIYQSKLYAFREAVIRSSSKCEAAAEAFSSILGSIENRIGAAGAGFVSAAPEASDAQLISDTRLIKKPKSEIDSAIENAALKTGLDPDLIRSVIRVESSFRTNAVSGCGAMGLMQLMPGTAKEMGVKDPFDPYQNVLGGAKYLKKQLDRFGDIRLALAAYNRGPGKIHSLKITDPDDPEQYSKISAGCRSYVKTILKYYEQYKNKG